MKSLIIFTLISLILCANPNGKKEHTQNWKDNNFYMEDSYFTNLIENKNDLCETYSRKNYIKLMENRNIYCSGDWCENEQFSCSSYPCYDMKNSIYNDYPEIKDIIANYIMAYSTWNRQIGQLNCKNVEKEKREIYGNELMDEVIKNIDYCLKLKHYESISNYFIEIIAITFVFILFLVIPIFSVIIFKIVKKREPKMEKLV